MMGNDQIEIVMAAYNGMPYICEQIDSILSQTDENWHLTVSDDGSTDGTDAVIEDYAARYPDKVRAVHSGRRFGGAMPHFMWLTEQCDAPYIAYCDDDDTWRVDKLSKLREAMRSAEATHGAKMPLLVFSDQMVTDAEGAVIAPSLMRYQKQYFGAFDWRGILLQNVVTGGAMMINRALADVALECCSTRDITMHDCWMAAVAARFGKIIYIDEPLGTYRQHGTNSVGAKNVGSLAHIVRKICGMGEIREALQRKKRQAAVFEQTYHSRLTAEERGFLAQFVQARSGPRFYWRNRRLFHDIYRLAGMMLLG